MPSPHHAAFGAADRRRAAIARCTRRPRGSISSRTATPACAPSAATRSAIAPADLVGAVRRRRRASHRRPDSCRCSIRASAPTGRWSLGARLESATRPSGATAGRRHRLLGRVRHRAAIGVQPDASASCSTASPARVWDFTIPVQPSDWQRPIDRRVRRRPIALSPRVTVDGGLRFETHQRIGRAARPARSAWPSLLPRAGFHWAVTDFWELGGLRQIRPLRPPPAADRSRLRRSDRADGRHLPLERDGRRPAAAERRRSARPASRSRHRRRRRFLVDRSGTEAAGDGTSWSLGFDARPQPPPFVRLAAIGRRETNLVERRRRRRPRVDLHDDHRSGHGHRHRRRRRRSDPAFYNRSPSTFGADRYLLTNPAGDDATFVGADMIGRCARERLFFMLGGHRRALGGDLPPTAASDRSRTTPACSARRSSIPNARGARAGPPVHRARLHHQDRGVLPVRARHHARADRPLPGRPALRAPGDSSGPESGAEAVRAFRNGRTRFTR